MDLANIDSSSEGIWIDVCHSAAANMSLVLNLADGRKNIYLFLGMLKQPQEATLKIMLQRHGRNVGEMAYFLVAQGLTCLWGFPCDASETFFGIPEIWFFFI